MFLEHVINPENLQVSLINFAVLGAIILISCISSKRFNFLHGFIVFVTLLLFVAGINVVIENNLLAGLQDPTTHWLYGFSEQYKTYTSLVSFLSVSIVRMVQLSFTNIEFIQNEANYWILFFAPVALWFVSSIFAHIFRKKR